MCKFIMYKNFSTCISFLAFCHRNNWYICPKIWCVEDQVSIHPNKLDSDDDHNFEGWYTDEEEDDNLPPDGDDHNGQPTGGKPHLRVVK